MKHRHKEEKKQKQKHPVSRGLTVNRSKKPRDGLDMQTSDGVFEITMITILKGLMDKWTIYMN